MCEVLLPGRHAAPVEQPRHDPGRPGHVVRLRAGVLPLPRRRAARVPARGLPRSAGRVLHRRRLQERRRGRARDRRRAHRPLPRGRHQPRGHQRGGREGPVGVPDLRQGLEARRRRDVDRPLPAAAALRALRRRRQLPPEAARRRARLERLGDAHELLDGVHARGRRQGLLRDADGRVRRAQGRAHRRLRPRQPHAADGSARDAVDRHVRLRRRRIAARRSGSRTASSTAGTAATSRIAGRTRSATRTGSRAGSCRRSRRCRPTRSGTSPKPWRRDDAQGRSDRHP